MVSTVKANQPTLWECFLVGPQSRCSVPALSRGNNQFPHLLARLVLIQSGVRLAFPAWACCWLMIYLLPAKTFSTELLPSLSFFSCCPCQSLSGVLLAAVLSEFTAPAALFLQPSLFLQAVPLTGSPAPGHID